MASGIALTDEHRWHWLRLVGAELASARTGRWVACSTLRLAYRALLRSFAPDAFFVHLTGTREVLASRMTGRSDHVMPLALRDSQLATLELLGADERGPTVDCTRPAGELARAVIEALSSL